MTWYCLSGSVERALLNVRLARYSIDAPITIARLYRTMLCAVLLRPGHLCAHKLENQAIEMVAIGLAADFLTCSRDAVVTQNYKLGRLWDHSDDAAPGE